jgi:hypothetical protein
MRISDVDYASIDESTLLRLVLFEQSIQQPNQKPEHALASLINCSPKHIHNCLAGETSLGVENWLRITRSLDRSHFIDWFYAKATLFGCEPSENPASGEGDERRAEDRRVLDIKRRDQNGDGRKSTTNPVQRVRTIRPGRAVSSAPDSE